VVQGTEDATTLGVTTWWATLNDTNEEEDVEKWLFLEMNPFPPLEAIDQSNPSDIQQTILVAEAGSM
jgi:hypothetical protein